MFKTLAELRHFITRQAFGQTTPAEDQAFEQHLLTISHYYPELAPFHQVDGRLAYTFGLDRVILGTRLGPVAMSFDTLVEATQSYPKVA